MAKCRKCGKTSYKYYKMNIYIWARAACVVGWMRGGVRKVKNVRHRSRCVIHFAFAFGMAVRRVASAQRVTYDVMTHTKLEAGRAWFRLHETWRWHLRPPFASMRHKVIFDRWKAPQKKEERWIRDGVGLHSLQLSCWEKIGSDGSASIDLMIFDWSKSLKIDKCETSIGRDSLALWNEPKQFTDFPFLVQGAERMEERSKLQFTDEKCAAKNLGQVEKDLS